MAFLMGEKAYNPGFLIYSAFIIQVMTSSIMRNILHYIHTFLTNFSQLFRIIKYRKNEPIYKMVIVSKAKVS